MRLDSPLVCICVPTYNAATTVRETIESILSQTYPNLILHVSDNASRDDTIKIIEAINDSRVHIHRNDTNVGGEGNFNRCIQLAEGKYTAIFHADDVYEPEMLAKQVAFLENNPEAAAVFTEAILINNSGKKIGRLCLPNNFTSFNCLYDFSTIFKSVLQYSNFLVCPSVLVRTEVYKSDVQAWNGGDFRTSADLDVWLRILRHHVIGIIQEPLMQYRISVAQHSEKLRSRTSKSDLFLVIDYYVSQQYVKDLLKPIDWMHYKWLQRTDRVVRAVNYYLLKDEKNAKELCFDVFSFDAFRAASNSFRGLITLLVGVLLRFFIITHLSCIGVPLLRSLKRLAGK